jgi:ABC-type multidrug transport system ATPase subunit
MSYRINGNPGYAGLAKTLADSYLSGTRINADFSTFALPINSSTGDSLQLILYITLALCAYPAFLALYPTFERLANVRALHYSSGVRPAPLWLGYLLFDGVIAVIMSVVVIVLLTVLSSAWYAPGYLFLAIFFYAVCSTLLAYTGSLFSKTQLSAFALVAGFQAISMLIYFILYLALLTFGTAERLQHNLNTVQYTYGLISPAGCLFRALLLALNQSQLLCRERSFVSYPGGIEVYGAPYLYLILQSFGLYAFLVCYDSYSWTTLRDRIRPVSTVLDAENMASTALNPSIRRELERTKSSEDELRLLNLSKRFHRETAVDDVTFGVDKGQILALLGPNGAGKTTTISLIRGDLRPSSTASQALVSGHSVQKEKLAAHRHLGVCPQFNATDRVTVREHLKFYARIRGVRDIDEKVHAAVKAFGLYEYRKRFVVQLSGGNQRRLSLATAMIGNPSVVLLDEPSTGMDALAMRKMWQLISSMKTQAAVVITTHSMEEASVLSDKAAIMRKRLLAVGSPDALRDSYAVGVYQLHIVHRKGSATSTREIEDILNWLMQSCPGLRLDGREASSMHGQIRCRASFENSNNAAPVRRRSQRGHQADHRTASRSLLQFLERLEETKERFGVAYYSVHRPTLEDVFLDILDNSA